MKCSLVALNDTLTTEMWEKIPKMLCMKNPVIVKETSDTRNTFFSKAEKPSNIVTCGCAERVYLQETKELIPQGHHYPETLCCMPLQWCGDAQAAAISFPGKPDITTTTYHFLYPGSLHHEPCVSTVDASFTNIATNFL